MCNPGSLTVLMGANGSGKSTLGMALAGHPHYKVTAGQAILDGKDLIQLPAHERARTGFFLSFQSPPDIPGQKQPVHPHRLECRARIQGRSTRWMRLTF